MPVVRGFLKGSDDISTIVGKNAVNLFEQFGDISREYYVDDKLVEKERPRAASVTKRSTHTRGPVTAPYKDDSAAL